MKRIEIESLLDFRFVSAPGFSPDGKTAAFVVQQADVEKNAYTGDLWLADCEGRSVRRLTTAGDAKSYVWSRQGTLLFAALREPKLREQVKNGEQLTCFYEIHPDGGEAKLAFTLPLAVNRILPVDDVRMLVLATHNNGRPDLDAMPQPEREQALKQLANPAYEVLEEAPFWFNGAGFTAGRRQRLYLYNRESGELTALTEPWFDVSAFELCGSLLLVQGESWQGMRNLDHVGREPIFLLHLDTGERREVLPGGVWYARPLGFWNEESALLSATRGEQFGGNQSGDFYTLNLQTGEMTLLADWDGDVGGNSVGSDARLGGGRGAKMEGGAFYFLSTAGESGRLFRLSQNGEISAPLTGEGSCDSFDLFGETLLCGGLFGTALPELYLGGEQLTHFNDAWSAEHTVSVPEFYSFTASDGFEIHGYAMKPAGYLPGRRYPAILHIHGGPRTTFGGVFHHEMQVWANAGYFVFYCNPRGSDGRGDTFADINGRYGTVDYDNIMEFLDEMLRRWPDVDPARVGVTGGSYGGFMTNWIIGHTNRFAAAASQRSIANWITFEHTSDIGPYFTPNNQAGTTRTDVQKMWWHSPIRYACNCKTPTLFIHADADYRCWMVEGLSMFTALKMHGCEARLCLFKDESHELSRSGRPRSRIRRMEEILGWMDAHLKA